MKTLTEFDGFTLNRAIQFRKEQVTARKTPEEAQAALAETFKLAAERLPLFMAALEVAEAKPQHLKRILVCAIEEGKAAPSGAVEKDGKHFLAEFFYIPQKTREKRGKRGPSDRGKRGKRGRGRDRKRAKDRADARPPRGTPPPNKGETAASKKDPSKPGVLPLVRPLDRPITPPAPKPEASAGETLKRRPLPGASN